MAAPTDAAYITARYAISDSGLAPARAQRTAVDQLMLDDPAIQRTGPLSVPRRVDQVYGGRPDLLVLASRSPTHFEGRYRIDAAMEADARRSGLRAGAGRRERRRLQLQPVHLPAQLLMGGGGAGWGGGGGRLPPGWEVRGG